MDAHQQPESPPVPTTPEPAPRVWLEVFVVLAVAVLPDIFYAVAGLYLPDHRLRPPWYTATYYVIRSLQVTAPVLYVMARSGRPWSYFGLARPRFWDLVVAVPIAAADLVVAVCYYLIAPADTNVSMWDLPQRGGLLFALSIGLPNGFAEELAMRGYLIPRLEQLLGTKWDGIFISAALFAGYHVYQGAVNAVGVFLVGLVYGIAFSATRRLWPVVLVHSTTNILHLI